MKNLMGEQHRRRIADSIPAGGRYLEWGSGGSTIWLAHNLPPDVEMVSIEHDEQWASQIRSNLRDRVKLISPGGLAGKNATIAEEDPTNLKDYINAADRLGKFDCILIDGVARTACSIKAQSLLKDTGTIFIHDAQRWWYDGAKAIYDEIETIQSCQDYPGPTLWCGRKKAAKSKPMDELVIRYIAEKIGGGFLEWLKNNKDDILGPLPKPAATVQPEPINVSIRKQNNIMLHINQVFWRGGTNLFMMDMAKAYPEFRHIDLYLYDGREDYELMCEFEMYGIEVGRIEVVTEKLLKQIDPAVLVFHNTPSQLRGRTLVEGAWPYDWLKQWPLIAVHHNPSHPAFHAALDVFVSKNVLNRYENVKQRMNWKLIPPCIDLAKYKLIVRRPNNERCIIGKLTSNSPARYPIELLRIFEEVQRQEPRVGFSLIGAADHWKTINLHNCETPATGSQDVAKFYAGFDIFVHRNQEGTIDSWGRIVSEAMASGLPVVTENIGGPAEQVDHGVNGYLCNNDNEFVQHILELARDPSLRHKMGMKAREKALAAFGIDRLRRETIGVVLQSTLGVV